MVDLWLLGMNMWKRDGYYSMARGMVRRAAIGILLRGSKDKFVSTLKKRNEGIPNHEGSICERTDLLSRAKTLYGSNPERCGRFTLDIKEWLDKIAEIRSNPIWNTVIAGNKDIDIAALIDELGNSPWVDQGRQYIRPGSNICPFCQQETLTDEFKAMTLTIAVPVMVFFRGLEHKVATFKLTKSLAKNHLTASPALVRQRKKPQ